MTDTVEEKLAALGLTLPTAPTPIGNYRRGVIRGGLGGLSGQFPLQDGRMLYPGVVGRDLTVEEGRLAARAAALNVLAQLRELLGGFDRLEGLHHVAGFIAGAPDLTEHAGVLNGASDLFVAVLDERGAHSRSAMGVLSLPMRAAVELVVTFTTR